MNGGETVSGDDNAVKSDTQDESDAPDDASSQAPVRKPASLSALVKRISRKDGPSAGPSAASAAHSPANSGHSGQANIEIVHSDYDAEQTDEEGNPRVRKTSTMGRFVGTLQVLKAWMVKEEETTKRADSFLERLAMGGPAVEMSPGGGATPTGDKDR